MRQRPIVRFRPDLERFEEKQLLSAGATAAHARAAALKDGAAVPANHAGSSPDSTPKARATGSRGGTAGAGYIAYRITNPNDRPVHLVPPFQQVLVQATQPVPGQVYNVLQIAVRNSTAKTFTAADGLTVRLPGFTGTRRVPGNAVPVLTGNQTWAPKTWIVFYALSHEYYPLSPQVAAGFQLQVGGRSSTLVPGPSAIFLRLKYDPATFAKTLDWIVAYGQGAQLGVGSKTGIADTAINVLVSAGTNRIDFGGHF
jgi:hypothetical protein